ncbi:MAG: hypothetical protein ABIG61_04695 [Planctomycetota bacterium]
MVKQTVVLTILIILLSCGGLLTAAPISQGDIFITVASPGKVYRITNGGDYSTATPFATGLTDAVGLVFSPDGRLYASCAGGRVFDITAGGDFSSAGPFAWGLGYVNEMTVTGTGRILVADIHRENVMDITGGGDFSTASAFATGLDGLYSLLATSNGRILAGDSYHVYDITTGGNVSSSPNTPSFATILDSGGYLKRSVSLTQGPNGRIYSSAYDFVVDITNGGFCWATPGFAYGLDSAIDIAFDSSGRFLASLEKSESVLDISAGGDCSGLTPFATGLNIYPQQIAIATIPDPATLFLLSLGALALLRKSRA